MGSVGIRFGRNVPLQHTDPYQKMKESDKGKGDNRPSEDYSANDGLMEPNPFVVSQKLLSRPYKKDKKGKVVLDKNGKPVDEFVPAGIVNYPPLAGFSLWSTIGLPTVKTPRF